VHSSADERAAVPVPAMRRRAQKGGPPGHRLDQADLRDCASVHPDAPVSARYPSARWRIGCPDDRPCRVSSSRCGTNLVSPVGSAASRYERLSVCLHFQCTQRVEYGHPV
jgi:hypothetical protein